MSKSDTIKWSLVRDLPSRRQVEALAWITAASRERRQSIGFVPRAGVIRACELGRLGLLTNNDDCVGFLLYGPSRTSAKVYQIWVRPDARMIVHGRAMIDALTHWARLRGLMRLSLWCAIDLPSSLFWEALGFARVAERVGSRRTGRRHARWVRSTIPVLATQFQDDASAQAGNGPDALLSSQTAAEAEAREAPQLQRSFFSTW